MAKRHLPVGIDDMAAYVPSLYLDIRDLAEARGIQYEKLAHGLGLLKMAFPDVHEDAATMAAEAITELMLKNGLRPEQIGRVYMGTESALDGAKPTATYAVEMVQQRLGGSFRHCDVVDMTFACIAATDALQNCLDWVAGDKERTAIVVASDFAKYEIESTGEYTQGAGAIAVLVKWNPRLLVMTREFGVAMASVHDFYKPRREHFTETPVFDGPFSNQCYQDRMTEALNHFRQISGSTETALSERWERMAFHLPYSYHAKRIFVEEFAKEKVAKGEWQAVPDMKSASQTPEYQSFVSHKLEKAQRASSEIGNLYTGSVFMALMSTLYFDARENSKLSGKKIGFVAYGSGSKSKVFEGVVQKKWQQVALDFNLTAKLETRKALDYQTYEQLHHQERQNSVLPLEGRFALHSIGTEGNQLGARFYGTYHLNGKATVLQSNKVSEEAITV
ncbi:MAG: hydroxymethylglutaryl-CoA synthase family protein [Saprospiraceae bacterium]|nr:hydroxymethylglutaryl-CoA synthase family protein [Saprospiraceae bacterium]